MEAPSRRDGTLAVDRQRYAGASRHRRTSGALTGVRSYCRPASAHRGADEGIARDANGGVAETAASTAGDGVVAMGTFRYSGGGRIGARVGKAPSWHSRVSTRLRRCGLHSLDLMPYQGRPDEEREGSMT